MKNDRDNKDKSGSSLAKTGKIKRYFFPSLLIILPLILLELFSFTYIKLTSGKGTYRERLKPVANPYHPYLGYVHTPNYTFSISKKTLSKKMSLVTDENGYSITPAFSYKNPDITIIITGGSTMFGVGSTDNSTTVPSILERLINQRLKIRTEVVNLALRGAQSFQEMLLVNRYLSENSANLVLAISGVNDAVKNTSSLTVEDSFLGGHVWNNAVPLAHRAERGDLVVINLIHKFRSWSYTFDLLYRKIIKNSQLVTGDLLTFTATPEINIRREALTNAKQRAKITATHFAAADQIGKMNDAIFVMMLQPTLYTKNNRSNDEARRIKKLKLDDDIIKTRRKNHDNFYAAFRKTEKPFQFIDLSAVFSESKETLYIDHYHYNDLAAEMLAEKIFESIRPILLGLKAR